LLQQLKKPGGAKLAKSFHVDILNTEILSKSWSTLTKITLNYTRNDGRSEVLVREVNDHGAAAAVLAYDRNRKTVLLVKQMRIAAYVAGYKEPMIEVCAGLLDGDDAETCALREAEEELGFGLHNLQLVSDAFVSPGALTERVSLFVGNYTPADKINHGGGIPSEGEDIQVIELSLASAYRMIATGAIVDAKTIILLQHVMLS
jgi:nudix-type nucleoside diphosphatase (YffH/AdpP family)